MLGRGFEADRGLDNVEGATLNLHEDAADVFAQDADGHELHAADQQNRRKQQGPTGRPIGREQPQNDGIHNTDHG